MRVLIATAVLQLGSAIQEQVFRKGLGDIATTVKTSREKPFGTTHDSRAPCEDALEGSICFKAATYIKTTGFRSHPDWYPEYNAESLFQDVQVMLNAAGRSDCPIPCSITTDRKNYMTTQEMNANVGATEEKGDGALAKMGQTFKVMKTIESKPTARDETDAVIEAEMMHAFANVKATEEREDGVHLKMAQTFKEMKKIESRPAARDETAADIEAEMLQAMADAKAWPEISTREDGVHAKMAQKFKVMKNIESKPAAQDESAEIEAEMLQAMADARLGLRA